MNKTVIKNIIVFIMLISLINSKEIVNATSQSLENNKGSIVQVVLTHTTEEGKRYVLQSGSGILINNNTVLTNYHIVHITDKILKKSKKLIGMGQDKELTYDAIQIGIVKKDDVLISAEITQESQEKNFSLLSLSETIDRTPAIFGSSSLLAPAENVIALGYPTTNPFSKAGAQYFENSDVNYIAGVVSEVNEEIIKVSGKISKGNSGGALVNASTGEVVGLLIFDEEDRKKECFKILPIDTIKNPYLAGTTYKDNSVITTTEEVEEKKPQPIVDKTRLDQTIQSALIKNREDYTSDSYLFMLTYLQQAKDIRDNKEATQEQVDTAQLALQESMKSLQIEKKVNWVLIIIIIILVLVLIAGVVVTIVILMKNKNKKNEQTQFKILPTDTISYNSLENPLGAPSQYAATNENISSAKNRETTVLGKENKQTANNATTLLNLNTPQLNAYLIRKKDGEKKKIDAIEYTVGADGTRVNYCISDNETISRCHMKIVTKGIQYFVCDLDSTNHTYVNDAIIPPNQNIEIKDKDSIKVSDEEFIFEIM